MGPPGSPCPENSTFQTEAEASPPLADSGFVGCTLPSHRVFGSLGCRVLVWGPASLVGLAAGQLGEHGVLL